MDIVSEILTIFLRRIVEVCCQAVSEKIGESVKANMDKASSLRVKKRA